MKKQTKEFFIWTETTLKEFQEHGEAMAWEDLRDGRCDHVEYTDRIGKIKRWVEQKVTELNN